MTIFGWDTSDYDESRGPMDVATARKNGIAFLSHKISEGTGFKATNADRVLAAGAAAKMPVLGGYHVLYGKNAASISDQVNWYLQCLTELFPGWKKHPCFIHQIDAEKFQYMARKPTLGEINTFGALVVERAGCLHSQVVAYAPEWLYGSGLQGLHFKLWASGYVNGSGTPQALYPGDGDFRWDAYSGIVPTLLQFSSSANIGGNHTCDANAVRVKTEEQLAGLFVPQKPKEHGMAMDKDVEARFKALETATAANSGKLDQLLGLFKRKGEASGPHHVPFLVRRELDEHGHPAPHPHPGAGGQ